MKPLEVLLVVLLFLVGCVTVDRIYTPDGQGGYNINCSGDALNWGNCYATAGQICGKAGYDVINRSGDQGSTIIANEFGLVGGSITKRSMIIKCKDVKPTLIVSERRDKKGKTNFGTAWVSEYGYVVTNQHVINNSKKVRLIKHDGKEIEAYVFMSDYANDIALLRVDDISNLPLGLPIVNMPAKLGSEVFTIGYPLPSILGTSPKLNTGVISGLTGLQDDPRTYQISIPVQAGNSGGPLLNMNGEVIGIVTYKLNAIAVFKWTGDLPENVNYAIKSSYIDALFSGVSDKKRNPVVNSANKPIEEISSIVGRSVLLVVAE